jgi:hypothetical protein
MSATQRKRLSGFTVNMPQPAMSGLSHAHFKADALAATLLARPYLVGKQCHWLRSRLVIFLLISFP